MTVVEDAVKQEIRPERAYVDVPHASLGVVRLEITGFRRVDDAVHTTFHLDAFARLDSQMCVRLEPVVRSRHQNTVQRCADVATNKLN